MKWKDLRNQKPTRGRFDFVVWVGYDYSPSGCVIAELEDGYWDTITGDQLDVEEYPLYCEITKPDEV